MAMAHLNFEALRDLHDSANHLLHSPQTKQSLLHQEKWVDSVSESSLTMLDVCGISKDVLSLVKEHTQDLRTTLRRSNNGETGEYSSDPIAAYNIVRRKLRKETVKCLRSLKGMKNRSIGLDLLPSNHSLSVVVEMLREVRATIVAIVESMSTLISIPWLEGKSNRGSLTTKLMGSRGRSLEDETAIHSAHKRLEAVEIAIEDLEMEIECMFRRLIQTRASLLNLLTY